MPLKHKHDYLMWITCGDGDMTSLIIIVIESSSSNNNIIIIIVIINPIGIPEEALGII